mmetsp:Transcript_17150/g.24134  ORF Transcript_17150/g.24134 Transcript_17150/m.24134 type:complete len:273 (+) Transcript_17150:103-921(+)
MIIFSHRTLLLLVLSVGFLVVMTDARHMDQKKPYYYKSRRRLNEDTTKRRRTGTATLSGERASSLDAPNTSTGTDSSSTSSSMTTTITVRVQADRYPTEIQWDVTLIGLGGSGDQLIYDLPQGQYKQAMELYEQTLEIRMGQKYKFHIQDLARDGICCKYGAGYYEITTNDGDIILAKGSTFDTEEIVEFSIALPPPSPDSEDEEDECYDLPNGQFEVNDVIGTQDCAWLVDNKEKYPWTCEFVDIALKCPRTCNLCQHLRPGWANAIQGMQ